MIWGQILNRIDTYWVTGQYWRCSCPAAVAVAAITLDFLLSTIELTVPIELTVLVDTIELLESDEEARDGDLR